MAWPLRIRQLWQTSRCVVPPVVPKCDFHLEVRIRSVLYHGWCVLSWPTSVGTWYWDLPKWSSLTFGPRVFWPGRQWGPPHLHLPPREQPVMGGKKLEMSKRNEFCTHMHLWHYSWRGANNHREIQEGQIETIREDFKLPSNPMTCPFLAFFSPF